MPCGIYTGVRPSGKRVCFDFRYVRWINETSSGCVVTLDEPGAADPAERLKLFISDAFDIVSAAWRDYLVP